MGPLTTIFVLIGTHLVVFGIGWLVASVRAARIWEEQMSLVPKGSGYTVEYGTVNGQTVRMLREAKEVGDQ